ncbi:MAG: ABC transporter ATP-binding protein [Gemmatimonadota bacterium]|nr:ABC transporter ATP-binding protein [Gemmatimonadota bacterium]
MILEAQGLRVHYPGADQPSLDGVGLRVEPGHLMAVVGPNGSGKTTMLRALLGLVPLSAGLVRLDGRPLLEWRRAEVAMSVATMPQREEPAPLLTAEDAVLLGRYPRLGALTPVGSADRLAVRRAMERCDAWVLRHRVVDTLSGGEWQRVRLARALAQEPRLLLLDEPTASLDVRHAMELLELVGTLVVGGLGVLIITHELNLAARYADRIVVLQRGRMVADGPPAEVITPTVLGPVFEWPLAITEWAPGIPQVFPLRPGESGPPLFGPQADR